MLICTIDIMQKIIIRMEGNEAAKTIKFVKGNSRDVKVKKKVKGGAL